MPKVDPTGEVAQAARVVAKGLLDLTRPADVGRRAIASFVSAEGSALPIERVAALMDATLSLANGERLRMVQGLERHARRQRALAQAITGRNPRLRELAAAGDTVALAELQGEQQWDVRVYQERQSAVARACDQPVRLDQRVFAIARDLAAALQ